MKVGIGDHVTMEYPPDGEPPSGKPGDLDTLLFCGGALEVDVVVESIGEGRLVARVVALPRWTN